MAAHREQLTRARILLSALGLVDREGMGGLTIRALATELEVTPMAVYRHVRNKAEIVDGLLDEVIRTHLASGPVGDPKGWLYARFCAIQRALVAHPAILPLLGETGSYGPSALAAAEEILGALQLGGLEDEAAVTAFHELISYTIGAAALGSAASRERPGDTSTDEWLRRRRAQFESLSMERFPRVVGTAHLLVGFAAAPVFEQGLTRILDRLPFR
jgi:AcrR family transcriptional regulator